MNGRAGPLALHLAGPEHGSPLLLVHSVNAAASAHEVKPIHERAAAAGRRVVAVDLPGFGDSARGPRDYSIRLFTDAVLDALDAVPGARVDGLGVSLGCEFLARAVTEAPHRFRSLSLVTPTGFDRRSARLRGPAGASREVPGVRRLLEGAGLGRGLFDLLVTRRSIRYFLRRTYGGREPDPELVEQAYETAHREGARHAPFAFLSARLFSRDVRSLYEALQVPVWVAEASRGDFRDFSGAAWARARPGWTFHRFDTGALPHFEQPDAFFAAWEGFLAALTAAPSAGAASSRSPTPS